MVEHSGVMGGGGSGFAVRAHVNIQGGFFPLCALCTVDTDTSREERELCGNINYRMVEEIRGGNTGMRGTEERSFVSDTHVRDRSMLNLCRFPRQRRSTVKDTAAEFSR